MNNKIKYYTLIASLLIGCFEANAQVQVEPYVGLTMPIRNIGASEVKESIDKYVDVSSKNNYHRFHTKESIEKRLERIYHTHR